MTRCVIKAETNDFSERFLSRQQVAARWGVSTETVKRRTRDGLLAVTRFNARLLRYRLSDVLELERDATISK
jgi:predicted site-specific integrase-resolvase